MYVTDNTVVKVKLANSMSVSHRPCIINGVVICSSLLPTFSKPVGNADGPTSVWRLSAITTHDHRPASHVRSFLTVVRSKLYEVECDYHHQFAEGH